MKLTIGYLYGDRMNIYGDRGNIIALMKRCQWRGIEVQVKDISIGERILTRQLKTDIDLYFFGGGQDQQQEQVSKDLISSKKGSTLKQDVERGIPLLSICGGYQLLGEYYKSGKGSILKGVGLFPAFTLASERRMIGNIIVDPDTQFDIPIIKNTNQVINKPTNRLLVGFENHSGKTYLEKGATPLGKVLNGFGNNGEDKTEGCVYKNAIGCYMHGSLLPKNPQLTDFLIKKALEVKYGKKISLKFLDDSLETQAHQKAVNLFA